MAKDLRALASTNTPVEQLVNALLTSAARKHASHVRVTGSETGGAVQFWIEGAWEEQLALDRALFIPIVRRLGVMIGVLPPRRGHPRFGKFSMPLTRTRTAYFLIAVDRAADLTALVELVDEETYESGRQPSRPSPHPYRQI